MDERNTLLLVALVLVVCGALVYLDWRRQGEIELLHDRLDGLDEAATRALADLHKRGDRRPDGDGLSKLNDRVTARAFEPLVDRILHAGDDFTLADIAREGAHK